MGALLAGLQARGTAPDAARRAWRQTYDALSRVNRILLAAAAVRPAIIIFGAAVRRDGTPSGAMRNRVEAALACAARLRGRRFSCRRARAAAIGAAGSGGDARHACSRGVWRPAPY